MRKLAVVVCPVIFAMLSGCSVAHLSQTVTVTNPVRTAMNGGVHGGQQPVVGAVVQLWQVGTTGYGVGAAPLGSSVLSGADGSFSITGKYDCNNASSGVNSMVYITATGGNPGAGTNSQLAMMTALGRCGNLMPSTFIIINEATTVASVYALAQFMGADGGVGSYGYSNTGLVNAFATVNNLVDISSGAVRAVTPAGNGQVPQMEINSLANIMAACVNSASAGVSPSNNCAKLFSSSTPTGAVAPTNTIGALLNAALNPWHIDSNFFTLAATNAPFQPSLPTQPQDWTMALSFAGGGTNVTSVAVDGSGSVWATNYAASAGSVSKLTPVGLPVSGSPFTGTSVPVSGPRSVAIDKSGTAWIVNYDAFQIIAMGTNGNSVGGVYSDLYGPGNIAIDGQNNLWIPNYYGNSVSKVNLGNLNDSTLLTGGGLSGPVAVAIDAQGNGWMANRTPGSLSKFSEQGTALSPVGGYTGAGISFPSAVALDSSGNAWAVGIGSLGLSKFDSSGNAVGEYTGGGLGTSLAVAIDGAGRVFALTSTPSVAEFSPAGVAISGDAGFRGGHMGGPGSMAIDPSGNVWIGNSVPATGSGGLQTVSEFIGLAAPVVTPLVAAVQQGQVGQRPGTPAAVEVATNFLPYYTPGTPYSAQAVAYGGNSGNFTWTLGAGSLPASLTLSSAGLISGTPPDTGTSTFTLMACDASDLANCAVSGPIDLTASTTLPVGGAESLLNGHYVIRFGGFNNFVSPNGGFVKGYDEVMSLSFNGTGGITAGEYDFNNPSNHNTSVIAVTGNYTLTPDHRGIFVLKVGGISSTYAFSVGNLNGSSIAQDVQVIEFDNTGAPGVPAGTGSGVGKLQTVATMSFNQSFVFGVDGETPCVTASGNTCSNGVYTPFGTVSAVGRFTGDAGGTIVSGQEDEAAHNHSYNGITLTGSYTAADAAGRGTLTLTPTGGTYPFRPGHYVYYVVSSTEMYVMSTDAHTTYSLVMGDVLAQTSAFSSATQLSGNFVGYESAPTNGNGVDFYPDQSTAGLLYVNFTGSNLTGTQDRSSGGDVQLGKDLGNNPYAFDANGRMTLAPDGNGVPVFYFANASIGFGTEQPNDPDNHGDSGLLVFEKQSAGPFSCNTGGGIYALGMVRPSVAHGVSNGSVAQTDATHSNAVIDNSDPSGVLTRGEAQTLTCVADQNGVTTATTGRVIYTSPDGGANVGYIVSPTKQLVITASPGEETPSVIVLQK